MNRVHPLGATLGVLTVGEAIVNRASATSESVTGFHQPHVHATRGERFGCTQTGQAGPHHDGAHA